jgi:ppGpp synthetase/RelA/SpoT-type nucleotidyltranferase
MMENEILKSKYDKLFSNTLLNIADLIRGDLEDILSSTPRIDRISVRAKTTDRFLQKAAKLKENGQNKYKDPINEIQDLIGARIITYYLEDVKAIESKIYNYYSNIEITKINPEMFNEFGYEGLHFILLIPPKKNWGEIPPKKSININ